MVDRVRIECGKTMDVDSDLGPKEGWNRQFHCKPQEFADDREWRLQIQLLHCFRIQNDALNFRWGREIWHLENASENLFFWPSAGYARKRCSNCQIPAGNRAAANLFEPAFREACPWPTS